MQVLLEGYYGHDNLGDDYILLSLLSFFKLMKDEDINVFVNLQNHSLAERRRIVESYYHIEFPFHVYHNNKHGFAGLFQHATFMHECDRWIIGGGGLFPKEDTRELLILLARILIGRFLGTRICMFGIEINPVKKPINKNLWRMVTWGVDWIATRNNDSAIFLRNIGYNRVQSFSDVTFALKLCNEKNESVNIVGQSEIYDLWGLGMPWTEEEMNIEHVRKRYHKLCNQIAGILDESDVKVYVLPFFPSDIQFIIDIFKLCKNVDRHQMITDEVEFYKKRALFFNARKCLCMRFHSLVFALYCMKPFVCISYSPKSTMLLKEYGLDNYYVEFGVRNSEFFYREFDLDIDAVREKYKTCNASMNDEVAIASKKLKKKAKAGERQLKKWIRHYN